MRKNKLIEQIKSIKTIEDYNRVDVLVSRFVDNNYIEDNKEVIKLLIEKHIELNK